MHKILTKEEIVYNQWIEALRSGEYKQITKRLGNKQVGYCAMGLLFHIATLNDIAISHVLNKCFKDGMPTVIMNANDSGMPFTEIAKGLMNGRFEEITEEARKIA
jgi:hypothetical protein